MHHPTYQLVTGNSPLLISIPHLGTSLTADVKDLLTETGQSVADTDWHLDHLYDFAVAEGASMLSATVSRYVIDLNRPPDGLSLYPGQTTTGLVPLETFHGEPVYREGKAPDGAQIEERVQRYWRPYHEALAAQIQAIKKQHGFVLLWEAHSINGALPRLFDGLLPDLNFGTFDGKSAGAGVARALQEAASCQPYSWVVNGRFKGGYITRQYGNPAEGIHAVQLEMSQRIYMNEKSPFSYRPDLAAKLQPVLKRLLHACAGAARVSADFY